MKKCNLVINSLESYSNNKTDKSTNKFIEKHILKCKDCKNKLLELENGKTLLDNLNKNLAREHLDNGYIMCECCGKRVKKTNNRVIYCEKCAKKVKNLQNKSYRDNKA